MKWNDYVNRRRISVNLWLNAKGISDLSSLIDYLQNIGVESPTPEEIEAIFPKPQPLTLNIQKNEVPDSQEIEKRFKKRFK